MAGFEIPRYQELDFIITEPDSNATKIGIGKTPTYEYPLLRDIHQLNPINLTPLHPWISTRNAVFIYDTIEKVCFFFKNKIDISEVDDNPDFLQQKAIEATILLRKFNIFGISRYLLITFDTPVQQPSAQGIEYFHQDYAGMNCIEYKHNDYNNPAFILRNVGVTHDFGGPKPSEYTIIGYREDCISTEVLTEVLTESESESIIIRFGACNGTSMCIHNPSQHHSTPSHRTDILSRDNSMLTHPGTRTLNRTQVQIISDDQMTQIGQILNDDNCRVISVNYASITIADFFPFSSVSIQDYVTMRDIMERSNLEIGGNKRKKIYKRCNKRFSQNRFLRKSNRKFRKSKRKSNK